MVGEAVIVLTLMSDICLQAILLNTPRRAMHGLWSLLQLGVIRTRFGVNAYLNVGVYI